MMIKDTPTIKLYKLQSTTYIIKHLGVCSRTHVQAVKYNIDEQCVEVLVVASEVKKPIQHLLASKVGINGIRRSISASSTKIVCE
jgi:hypothetical protein